jgi:BirA family biotin operon repressor/biotin-[acetyl-CoA-carboxylase] ligase
MTRTGHPFIEIPTLESTNIHAMEQARARLAAPGTAFFAHAQTRGKGQRGRQWHSAPGENIAISLLVEPPDRNPAHGFPLSCATAMGCYDFYKSLAGDETAIKWPNDIYWRDRKAGGILIENIIRSGRWEMAVVGIGININQTLFDPSLPNPVSLRQITGKQFEPVVLARSLCEYLDYRYRALKAGEWTSIYHDYLDALFGKGRRFRFRSGEEIFEATVTGITEDGQLELSADGWFRQFAFGQLEWLSLQPLD